MDEPYDLPKKRGRPRVAEPTPGVNATTWLRPAEYDKLIKIAHKHDLSISALLRTWLRKQLR